MYFKLPSIGVQETPEACHAQRWITSRNTKPILTSQRCPIGNWCAIFTHTTHKVLVAGSSPAAAMAARQFMMFPGDNERPAFPLIPLHVRNGQHVQVSSWAKVKQMKVSLLNLSIVPRPTYDNWHKNYIHHNSFLYLVEEPMPLDTDLKSNNRPTGENNTL